jgi:3-hydroxybutyrate dehydrogenase
MKLKNKVALVTGATSGIGLEIAKLYAKEGAKVVIASRHSDASNQIAQMIKDQGGEAMGVAMDVGDEDQVNDGVDAAVTAYGSIDILVSNAGFQHIEAVDKLEFSIWRKMLTVQLDGAFLTSKACLKHMYKSGRGGSIIFMGSVHSKFASKLKAPYVTAKHGLLGLCRVIAKEGAEHGVRCNVICPGFVRTPLVDKQIPEQARTLGISEEDVVKKVMLGETVDGEFTTINDIAQVALFFAGFESNALTGQSMIASHGWVME